MGIGQDVTISVIEEVVTVASSLLLTHFTNLTPEDVTKFKTTLSTSPELPKLLPFGVIGIAAFIIQLVSKLFIGIGSEDKYKFLLALQDSLNQTTLAQGQNAINVVETELAGKSTNFLIQLFWAGWRPVTAWSCTIFFVCQMIKYAVSIGAGWLGHPIPITPLENSSAFSMLGALLGLGGFRTLEKFNGTNQDK